MDFAVVHRIHDLEGWGKALKSEPTYPPDFNLHSFVEAQNRHLTLCVAGGAERGVEGYVPGWRARV